MPHAIIWSAKLYLAFGVIHLSQMVYSWGIYIYIYIYTKCTVLVCTDGRQL